MANHRGIEGVIKLASSDLIDDMLTSIDSWTLIDSIGGELVLEVRGWEFTETGEVIEDTTLSDASKTFQPGNKGGSGSVSCWWDETDSLGQESMSAGAAVTLNLYPEGADAGDTFYSCAAVVNSVQRSAAINGLVEAVFGWTAAGVINRATL